MSFVDTIRANILYIRVLMAIISWTGIILRFVVAVQQPDEIIIEPLKFFTIQSNVLVAIWLTLSVLYKDYRPDMNNEKMEKLYGLVRGGVTAFITLTWLAYWALLSGNSDYTPIWALSSKINHYITPIYFIIDWFITERRKYSFKFVGYWMIYPLVYLVFAYFFQLITDDPIYGFFSISDHGFGGFITISLELVAAFLIFCLLYFGLNKVIVQD